MDEREMVRNLSMSRVAVGAAGLLAPRMASRALLGRGHAGRAASFLVRLWAAREVAVGMATLYEMEKDQPSQRVVELNAAVDGVDALAALVAWPALPRRTRLVSLAGGLGAALVSANYLRTVPRA